MARLPWNRQLCDLRGNHLRSLLEINALPLQEKEGIYSRLIPQRLLSLLYPAGPGAVNRLIRFTAPAGLGLLRMEARVEPSAADTVFFLDIADTQFRQLELAFCMISDPSAPRFDVDRDNDGRDNCFATLSRNRSEEERAMRAGLFPHQTRRGLRMFGDFFTLLESFADALGLEMIVAEPLTYDNAIRYEKYGFDYLTGRRLMQEINREFQPGGRLTSRLNGSTPFRFPGMERTIHGRSWAIHDGILDEPWDGVRIYKIIGVDAAISTFTGH